MNLIEQKGKDGKIYKSFKMNDLKSGESYEFVRSGFDDKAITHPQFGTSYIVKLQYQDEWISTFFNQNRYDELNKQIPKGSRFKMTCVLKENADGKPYKAFEFELLEKNLIENNSTTPQQNSTQVDAEMDKRYMVAVSFLMGELTAEPFINVNGKQVLVGEYITEIINIYK